MRPTLAASAAIFRDDGRVLLASRTKAPSDGLFSLPGGRVEAGESLREAAIREVMEEVGIAIELLGFADHAEIIEHDESGTPRIHYVVCCFAARWLSGEPQTGPEAGEIIWADDATLAGLKTTKRLPQIVTRARQIWRAEVELTPAVPR